MDRDRFALGSRLLDGTLQFCDRELRLVPAVGHRRDAARRADLDEIRAGHEQLADDATHAVNAVGDTVRQPGAFRYPHPGRYPEITVTTCL